MPIKPTGMTFYCKQCHWSGKPQSDAIFIPSTCPKCGSHEISARLEEERSLLDTIKDIFR